MLELDPRRAAVVLIDFQKGTLAMPLQPHSGAEITANAVRLAEACAAAGGLVVRIRIDFSPGYIDRLQQPVDMPIRLPPGNPPADFAEFPPEIAAIPSDLTITKRQWSAFFGTELDLQLRRRGIATVILGGIATNFGVESTARDAWYQNYSVVVAEDATSSLDAELHRFSIEKILPRLTRVRATAEIIAALATAATVKPEAKS
jgi:nicotinamidase-related amidase